MWSSSVFVSLREDTTSWLLPPLSDAPDLYSCAMTTVHRWTPWSTAIVQAEHLAVNEAQSSGDLHEELRSLKVLRTHHEGHRRHSWFDRAVRRLEDDMMQQGLLQRMEYYLKVF